VNFFTINSSSHVYSPSTEGAFFKVTGSRGLISSNSALEYPEPIDVLLATAGRKWMDFLTPKYSYSPLLCSQRVVDSMIRAKLTGFKALLTCLEPPEKKQIAPPCPYYWLIPTGKPYRWTTKLYSGSQKTHKYLNHFESDDGIAIREYKLSNKDCVYEKRTPIEQSWDGNDFNRYMEDVCVGVMGFTLCSRRVVDLAASEKWTNIEFSPFLALEPVRIDHLNGVWPPKSFYSKYEPE